MKRGLWVWVSLVTLAWALCMGGCETRVKETLQEKLQARAEQGKEQINKLLADRDERIASGLKQLDLENLQWDGTGAHPLMEWEKQISTDPSVGTLKEMAPKYPGTELEKLIPKYLAYVQTGEKYWKRFFVDKTSADLREYYQFLRDYSAENKTGPFYDDAMFELMFLHASYIFGLQDIPAENRPTAVFRYWQLAFNFPSLNAERFEEYIARLCSDRFPTFCKEVLALEEGSPEYSACDQEYGQYCRNIAFECRGVAVMKPYYQVLVRRVEVVMQNHPDTPYMPALKYLKGMFEGLIEKLKQDCEEYPILPDSMAFLPASQRLVLNIGPRGIKFGDRDIETSADESFALSEAKARELESVFAKNLSEIRRTGEPELKQGQIAIMAAKETPAGAIVSAAWSPMLIPEEEQSILNQAVYLVGRRRFDGTNAKAATEIILFPRADAAAKTIVYPGGSATCTTFGYTGESAPAMPNPTAAVLLTSAGKVVAGVLNPETGAIDAVAYEADVASVDLFQLSKWASDQTDAIVLGIGSSVSYEAMLKVVGPLAFRCTKEDCTVAEPRAKPNIYVSGCP